MTPLETLPRVLAGQNELQFEPGQGRAVGRAVAGERGQQRTGERAGCWRSGQDGPGGHAAINLELVRGARPEAVVEGLRHSMTRDAEVISSIGVALALVRETVERVLSAEPRASYVIEVEEQQAHRPPWSGQRSGAGIRQQNFFLDVSGVYGRSASRS